MAAVATLSLPAGSDEQFKACFEHAQSQFQTLVTLMPELVERYEAVDEGGASVRRYMINDPESHIETVPAVTGRLNREGPLPDAGVHLQDGSDAPDGSLSKSSRPEARDLAEAMARKDAAYMERRYRSNFALASTSSSKGLLCPHMPKKHTA